MNASLSGRTVIVTGAASGMGLSHARAFAHAGASVVMTDVADAEGEDLARTIRNAGGKARFLRLDVTDEGGWQDAIRSIADTEGSLDILVHNAGGGIPAGFEQTTLEDFEACLRLNTSSSFMAAKAMVPLLRRGTNPNMVFVSSTGGLMATPDLFAYGPSKSAVCHLVRTLAVSLAPEGIRVNGIAPGLIDTPMSRKAKAIPEVYDRILSRVPMGRAGAVEEASAAVLFLASDAASYVNGVMLPVDGGALAL
ncbi:SDR family NAD(P)-dependent oxidoreductase [Croceicoccus bisphenolivorans]|uniref:SDR family NAD(P)-dependent oxidoreductase n=1 Tax=Croceicoccus bisphenolivorans TaxID=1783232 RepID=UPI00082B7825|nr:SDR family NAD(P)-dependent oxidoreductase [Croceicoccus bisphenolivorans]